MPKVIQVNAVSNYGSTGKIMEAIGLQAEAAGWDSKVATGARYSCKSNMESYQISSAFQNRSSALNSMLTGRHGLANVHETKSFIEWLKAERPDVIHLHNIHSYYINYKLLFEYLSESRIPTIWTLHDCWPFTGHCSHFIGYDCYKWKDGCHNCPAIHAFPKSLFFDRSVSNYKEKKQAFTSVDKLHLVTVSRWLGECASNSFLGGYPLSVISNGVDLSVFRPAPTDVRIKYGLEDKKILLGVSTDWCRAKGLYDYIELRKVLSDDYAIVLVGMTEKLIKTFSSTGIVCLPKTKTQYELVEWYNGADVVLNISYAETFGLPVAEGFACGTAAVVYDNTALSELISPETGIKVPTGSIQALSEAIREIAGTSRISSHCCRQRAEKLYDKRNNYEKYLDLYKFALSAKRE